MDRDGKTVREERTITLVGGQAQELSFAVSDTQAGAADALSRRRWQTRLCSAVCGLKSTLAPADAAARVFRLVWSEIATRSYHSPVRRA